MTLDTSALRIGTTLVSVAHSPLTRPLVSTSRPRARLQVETLAQQKRKESRRSPTWSARYTLRSTTLRSRLTCSAAGCTNKTRVFAPLTTVRLASPKCSSLTTQTHFLWVRASTRRRNSMTRPERSAASARTSLCPKMRLSPGNEEQNDSRQLIKRAGEGSSYSVEKKINQKVLMTKMWGCERQKSYLLKLPSNKNFNFSICKSTAQN